MNILKCYAQPGKLCLLSTNKLKNCFQLVQNRWVHSTNILDRPICVNMPSLSPTMNAGTIVKWNKAEGDIIKPGEVLCEIQTDKAVVSYEYDEAGVLAKIVQAEGTSDIAVGGLIAMVAEEGEEWKNVVVPKGVKTSVVVNTKPKQQDAVVSAPVFIVSEDKTTENRSSTSTPKTNNKIKRMGPAARLLLHLHHLQDIVFQPTGPSGTLLKSDVLAFLAQGGSKGKPVSPTPVSVTQSLGGMFSSTFITKPVYEPLMPRSHPHIDHQLSDDYVKWAALQKSIKTNIPHFYSSKQCTLAMELENKASLAALVVKFAGQALKATNLIETNNDNIGFLLFSSKSLPQLVTFSNVSSMGLSEIEKIISDLQERLRKNESLPADVLQVPASLTVCDFSKTVVSSANFILAPPAPALLAIGQSFATAESKQTSFTLSLSSDARVLDETVSARLLGEVAGSLEFPFLSNYVPSFNLKDSLNSAPILNPRSHDIFQIGLDD